MKGDLVNVFKDPAPLIIEVVRSWKSWGILPSLGRQYVSRFEKSLGIWGDLLNPTYGVNEQAIVPSGRLHQITLGVLNYSSDDM